MTACAIAVWLFVLGAVVGSFLNVVVYRVPAGLSLIRPGSHCPACKRPIRWYDNVPIAGWFVLRGRCRDCRLPISPRYPAVEAVTAIVFLTLGTVELLGRGANLPLRPIAVPDGQVLLRATADQLSGTLAYHVLLVSTLLTATLIEYDRHRLPGRVLGPAFVAGILAPLAWPGLRPVPAWPMPHGWMAGLVDGVAGMGMGLLMGLILAAMLPRDRRFGFVAVLGCVGLFLGWQAAAVLAAVAAAVHLAAAGLSRWWRPLERVPPTAWLALASLGWILAWKVVVDRWPAIG